MVRNNEVEQYAAASVKLGLRYADGETVSRVGTGVELLRRGLP